MTSLPAQTLFTPEEYITQERKARHKSEYLNGQIFAMSGASRAHSLITRNIFNRLYNQLMGSDCEVHSSDMRVQPSPKPISIQMSLLPAMNLNLRMMSLTHF